MKRVWTQIDLSALERNISNIRAALPKNIRYIAAVKADAYGHGLPAVVQRLMHCQVDAFAVANVHEGGLIRDMGHGWPVLVLSPILPDEAHYIFRHQLTPTISSLDEALRYQSLAKQQATQLPVHLKIDTGMGRAGVWHTEAKALYQAIVSSHNLELQGIFTHLASADTDPVATNCQRALFWETLHELKPLPESIWIHADNSAGLETLEVDSAINALRVGIAQYGITPYKGSVLTDLQLTPVMSFHTRVTLIKHIPTGTAIGYGGTYTTSRPTQIALIAAGYGDGLSRALSNRGYVIIHNRRCPIIGRISMDQAMIDTTDLETAPSPGDLVTLIGTQGHATITASEFAQWAGTIPYEVFCSITKRVDRVYNQDTGI